MSSGKLEQITQAALKIVELALPGAGPQLNNLHDPALCMAWKVPADVRCSCALPPPAGDMW